MLGEKVALKYAQALFEVGKDENAIELFRTWLKNLEMIFEENSELREFISSRTAAGKKRSLFGDLHRSTCVDSKFSWTACR